MKKGTHTAKKAKVWHRTTFKRPTCLKQKRSPKNILHAVKPVITFDAFAIIKYPLNNEVAMKCIEDNNTLQFIVHKKATKPQIRAALKTWKGIKAQKVNTLITTKGEKKAFIKLTADQDALDVA